MFRILTGSIKTGFRRTDLWLPGFLTALMSPGIVLYPVIKYYNNPPFHLLSLNSDTVILTAFIFAAAAVLLLFLGSMAQVRLIEKTADRQSGATWTTAFYHILIRIVTYSAIFLSLINLRDFRLYGTLFLYNMSTLFVSVATAVFLLIFIITSISYSYALRLSILNNVPLMRAVAEGVRTFWQNPAKSITACLLYFVQLLFFTLFALFIFIGINILPVTTLLTDPLAGLKFLSAATVLFSVPAAIILWSIAGATRDIFWTSVYLETVDSAPEFRHDNHILSAESNN